MSTQQRFALRWKLCTSGTFEGESHPRLGDVGAAEMALAIEAKVPISAHPAGQAFIVTASSILEHVHALTSAVSHPCHKTLVPQSNPSVTALRLSAQDIGDAGGVALAHALAACATVTSVDLAGNALGEASLVALGAALGASSSALANLSLSGNSVAPTDAGIAALAAGMRASRALRSLGLANCQLSDAQAVVLFDALADAAALTSLDVGSNATLLGDADSIGNASAALARLVAACPLAALTMPNMPAIDMSLVAHALRSRAACELDARNCALRESGGTAIAQLIAANGAALRSADLSNNLMGDRATVALAAALRPQPAHTAEAATSEADAAVQTDNHPVDAALGSPASSQPAAATRQCALHTLRLSGNRIGDSGALAFAAVLRENACPALKVLELTNRHVGKNLYGDEASIALADALTVRFGY